MMCIPLARAAWFWNCSRCISKTTFVASYFLYYDWQYYLLVYQESKSDILDYEAYGGQDYVPVLNLDFKKFKNRREK